MVTLVACSRSFYFRKLGVDISHIKNGRMLKLRANVPLGKSTTDMNLINYCLIFKLSLY